MVIYIYRHGVFWGVTMSRKKKRKRYVCPPWGSNPWFIWEYFKINKKINSNGWY
jgi:hypothetical protein